MTSLRYVHRTFPRSQGTHIVGSWVIDSISIYRDPKTGTQHVRNWASRVYIKNPITLSFVAPVCTFTSFTVRNPIWCIDLSDMLGLRREVGARTNTAFHSNSLKVQGPK